MPIRLSGINSGLDTDAIVKELVSAYSLKTEKYQKEQTKIEWKQDAWKSLNTKIYGLYTNVSNLRFDSAYNLRRTSVSDASKASVTASSDAVTGTQKLNILQTAQASYITGGYLGEDVTSTTKLSDLGISGEATFKVKGKDGKETEITVNGDTVIADLMQKFREAGLNANFDENNHRVFVSAKDSGAAADFDLVADDIKGGAVLSALGLTSSTQEAELIQGQADAYKAAQARLAELEATYGADYDYQAKIDEYNAVATRYSARKSLENIVAAVNASDTANGTFSASGLMDVVNQKGDVEDYLRISGLSDEEIEAVASDIKNIFGYSTDKYGSVLTTSSADLKSQLDGLQAEYDVATEAVNLKAEVAATSQDIKDVAAGTKKVEDVVDTTNSAFKIVGQDAIIKLNGVTYTNGSNSFSINGLTIDAQGVTGDGDKNAISITTTVDTQGIYDKVKDFLTEYNNVINEITKLYNAESASEYEPLTDEEKDAMSEEQIEKWEDKIKSSLLRRDNSLGSIMTAMVNSMSQSIEVNGEVLSLSSFGIQTLGFLNAAENEQYAYHIDGDADDENSSGKTDKLMKAIQENPDQIYEFMKKLSTNLYNAIDTKMKSTELSSAYKVYNDKELDTQLTKYKKLISDWEDKVAEQEEYYYNKFSDMEVALSKLQSQTNALSGLLGQ